MKRSSQPRFVNASALCLVVMLLVAPVISAGETGSLGRPAAFDAILRREPPAAAAAPEALPWEWQDPLLVYDGSLACEEGWPQGGADLAADDSGNLYAAWLDCRTGEARAYFAFRPAGGAWGPSEPVDDPTHLPQGGIHVAVDGAGNAYLAWLGGEMYEPSGIYSRYRSSAGTWGAIEQVESSDQDYQSDLDFTVDLAGNAYAVWLRVTYSPDYQQEVRFRRRPAGGGWGGSELVTGTTGVQQGAPQVAADSGGNIFVAWTDDSDGGDWDLYVAPRTGAGVWGAGVQVNDDAGTAGQSSPRLDADGAGKLVLAWLDNRDGFDAIYWAVKPPEGSWGANQALTDATDRPFGVEGLDVNDAGAAAVIWEGFPIDIGGGVFANYLPAGGTWGAREQVTYRNGDPHLAIAVDGDNVATAIQSELNIRINAGCASYERNGYGSWLGGYLLNDNANPGQRQPALAVDAAGNSYVAWVDDREGQSGHIYFAYRPAGGEWGANERVDHDPYTRHWERPDIAVDATGNAFVIWRGSEVDNSRAIYSAYRPAGGSWGASELVVGPMGLNVTGAAIAIDTAGNAHVAFANDSWGISYAYRPSGGTWGTPVQINDSGVWADIGQTPDIAVDGDGNVHVVWSGNPYSSHQAFHDYLPAGGGWGTDTPISNSPSNDSIAPLIVTDSAGNAQLVWYESGLYAAYRPAGGSWEAPQLISSSGQVHSLAVDGLGNFHVFWMESDGAHFAYRPPGQGWTAPQTINGVGGDSLSGAADANGGAYLVWSKEGMNTFQISHLWFSHAAYIGATQGNIAGMITAQNTGSSLQGISVTVFRFNGSAWVEIPSADASTDPQGYYATGALDPGDYRVRFSDSTGAYMTEYFDDASSIDAATDIGVSAGLASMADAVLALAPPGGIAGTVTDDVSAATLPSITVTLYGITPWGVFPFDGTTTNSLGAYTFTGLTPGTYFLEFADQQGAYVGEFYDNASQLYAATSITVAAGGTTVINVGLQPLSAPPVAPVVTISRDGANVVLAWTHNSANSDGYQVLFSPSPYFQPGDDNVTTMQATELTGWVHTGAAADADNNYCYLVRGVNAAGQESAPSNRTCEFTLRLTPGSVTAAAQLRP